MPVSYLANVQRSGAGVTMMGFVRETKWMSDGLSVVRGGPDNASEVCAKWRDHKMSDFCSPEVGTSKRHLYQQALRGHFVNATKLRHATSLLRSYSRLETSCYVATRSVNRLLGTVSVLPVHVCHQYNCSRRSLYVMLMM